MNIQQTAELLAIIQVIDSRRVDEATVLEWHALVGDLDLATAVEAVRLHRMESTAYLLPAHVRAGVERILNADPEPIDQFGNPLDRDQAALNARDRISQTRKAVTA